MTPWVAQADEMSWDSKAEIKVAVTDSDPVNARILKLATDLGNTVLAKKAANDLQTSVTPFPVIGHALIYMLQYQSSQGTRV
jgi:hypothetical protein